MGHSKENNTSSLAKDMRYVLPQVESIKNSDTFSFSMINNGYFKNVNGEWSYDETAFKRIAKDKKGQYVSFCGPGSFELLGLNRSITDFVNGMSSPKLIETLQKIREVDEDIAKDVAFSIGNIIRFSSWYGKPVNKKESIEYVANKINLSDSVSIEALTDAMVMYVLSKDTHSEDPAFKEKVYYMAEAVSDDPITVDSTEKLGLSQVARLHKFIQKSRDGETPSFPDISDEMSKLTDFPTVGAEFHFPLKTADEKPNFWERLALLNMSQYQKGSYIQLSRNDRDVIEVRMNPSEFPVTIANWNHMRQLLPELNRTFFTVTYNQKTQKKDYTLERQSDAKLLKDISALGYLCYATVFETIPTQEKREEINFGSFYLGQTVRKTEKGFEYTGHWSGNDQSQGQFALYSGFGDNFINLAYYPTMALMNPTIITPDIAKVTNHIYNLKDALALDVTERTEIFTRIDAEIQKDEKLLAAHDASQAILQKLQI